MRRLHLIILLFFVAFESYGAFQAAVITLVFPSGARTRGMGEVGTALADDETVLYYNPAGLGAWNSRWRGGAQSHFTEMLLPALKLRDLWHHHIGRVYQGYLFERLGGFGHDINFISFGDNTMTDEEGRIIARFRSWEGVVSLGYGFNLEEYGIKNHSWGITAKYVHSALAPGIGEGKEGIGQTWAVDVGYLLRFFRFMRFGINFANMGPPIFYISKEEADPIPFTINLALAFKGGMSILGDWMIEYASEFRMDREFAKNYVDKAPDPFWRAIKTDWSDNSLAGNMAEINYHLGHELTICNTVSFRTGFLLDLLGERYERTFGIGVKVMDHLQWDFYFIHSPEGYFKDVLKKYYTDPEDSHRRGSHGVRHGQFGISFTIFNMAAWSETDSKWWKRKKIKNVNW